MHEQLTFPRPDELPSISSSTDPISSSSPQNQPPNSSGVGTILPGRTRSYSVIKQVIPGPNEDLNHNFGEMRGRSDSPIRENVKRRRSVASAPGDALGRRPSRRNNSVPFLDENSVSLRNGSDSKQQAVVARQEPTPERSTKRKPSLVDGIDSRKLRKSNEMNKTPSKLTLEICDSIKRSLKVTKGSGPTVVPPLPLFEDIGDSSDREEPAYERKGAFRLKKDKAPDEFRFPKSRSHPEPLWRAGDGFSANEAKPSFGFFATGKNKQKKPRSTPDIGELQLETYDRDEDESRRSGVNHRRNQRLPQYEMKHRRNVAMDVWPTIENFSEELEVRRRNPTVPANEEIIPSTLSPQPTLLCSRETFGYIPLSKTRTRTDSDFENFGGRFRNGDMMSNKCILETQIGMTDGTTQFEPESDGNFDNEAEYEECEPDGGREYYEFMSLMGNDSEVGGSGEHDIYDESDASDNNSSRESGVGNSVISTLDESDNRPRELERYCHDIMDAGDISRELFEFSQAFS